MQALTKLLLEKELADRVLTDFQLSHMIDGSAQRRHHLVNRALKAKELIRLRRGAYVLAKPYRKDAIHPFAFAQIIAPGSYISLETSLAYHGWIPEAVYETAGILPTRKSNYFEN